MLKHDKAMVGQVIHSGNTYLLKHEFSRQCVFSVKVTPLGAHLDLLEGREDRDFQGFVDEVGDWFINGLR